MSNFSKKFSSEKFKNMLKRPCLVCWWRAIQTKGRGERRPWRLWLKDGRERASENLKNYYFPFYLFGNTNFWYFILDWKICTKWRMRWRQKQLWADFDWTFRLSIGAESAKKCCPFFWSESFIYFVEFWSFGRVRFTCLGLFFLCWNAWWWCDCCGCRSDIPVGGTDGERKRERNIKGGQNTREI